MMRPAVIPKLSELPADREQRNGILDQSHAEPGPEQKPKSKLARKVETAAATAAAVVGLIFSKHANVMLGGATTFDENRIVHPEPEQKKAEQKPPPVEPREEPLVPWVQLK